MAMPSIPVKLTENDIPRANLEGTKPEELKKGDLLFWLRCRGDCRKGLNVKARLVKRYSTAIDKCKHVYYSVLMPSACGASL